MDTLSSGSAARLRPWWRGLWLPAAVAVAVLLGVSLRLFSWPMTDSREATDAVVVLAGASARLDVGLALVGEGLAPTLVISNGEQHGWARGNALCAEPQAFEVLCFRPQPQTTAGEAEAIALLAEEQGWDAFTVVTSPTHVTRARLLVEQCTSTPVSVVAHDASLGDRLSPAQLARETLALIAATTFAKAC